MFEAVIALCANLESGPCRDGLLPGYEGVTAEDCETQVRARPPDMVDLPVRGVPRCVAVGNTLPVTEVAPGVFVHRGQIAVPDRDNRGDVSNLGFVIGTDSIAVIDTGAARWVGEALWRSIRQHSNLPVSHVILTHMHPDHVFGASVFSGTGAQFVGHANLPRALSDRQANYAESLSRLIGQDAFAGTRAVALDHMVQDRLILDLGGRELTLQAWQTAHTEADVTVRDHLTGTLFAGDLVFDDHAPALDGKVLGWQAVLTELGTQPITQIVPGHGGPVLPWPDGLQGQQRYLGTLIADTRAAIARGLRLSEAVDLIAADEASEWDLFEDYNPRNATVAFTELEWE